jgi:prepilin-type N-terminal cleavage/methylation domain-containing protein
MKRFPKAFTMLEVLLAVTIFVLVVTGLYTAFRVGVRSYELSDQAVDSAQQARIVFDTLTRDLHSVYYAQETAYNTTVRSYRAKFDTERQVAEREGTLDAFYERMLLLSEKEGRNPYDYGIAIDLRFNAENHERTDSLSFVREQLADPSLQTEPWALARVTYDVEDGELVRATDSVFAAPIDLEGNEVEKPQPEKHALAKRIKTFDLAWGYFYEGEWYEAPDWAADERRYRNPVEELDEGDPEYEQLRREQEAKPVDGIPSYLLVTLGIADKKRPEKIKTFQTLIRIPSAQENNIPLTDEERQRLEETGVRERIPREESSETSRLEK